MDQNPQQVVVVKSGGASGVFWGLFLFFVALPIGSCVSCAACVTAAGTGTAVGTAVHK